MSTISELSSKAVASLKAKGLHCTFAESLTGGLIAATLVNTSGASEVFEGSLVSYCDKVKHEKLGVDEETLATKSAVSYECAMQMAKGALGKFDADVAISATGYAGPGGGTPEDPAGTFYLGFADKNGNDSIRYHIEGTRSEVRDYAVEMALSLLIERVESL